MLKFKLKKIFPFLKKKKKHKKFFSFPRFFAYSFAVIAMVQAFSLGLSLSAPEMAYAAKNEPITYTMQVPIPGLGKEGVVTFNTGDTKPIADYVKAIYNYAVGIVGILAAIMLMVGGFRWILAGGNASSIGEAKEIIFASLSGLVLVMASWLILQQINPALTELNVTKIQKPNVKTAKNASNHLCKWTTLTDSDYIAKTTTKSSNFDKTCATAGDGWKNINDVCSEDGKKDDAICCCAPLPAGCTDYLISCMACEEPTTITGLLSNFSCKYPQKSCQVANSFYQKLLEAHNNIGDIKLEITEAWPPTVNHSSLGHKNGTCIDMVTPIRGIMSSKKEEDIETIEKIYTTFKDANLNILYECYPGDKCNCNTYNKNIKCDQTETGEDAGGKNHFHVCN
ncbi:MAG: pilin [Patescibacteria group bacterium]|jgi:hypothetical protein